MLTLGLSGRIWICTTPQDGRKSFDGLQAVLTTYLAKDPLSGDLYVFRNKRGDRACARVLESLYRLMCDRVRLSASLHTDDTPVLLLAPRRTAHAWVYVGDAANPYTVFDLSVGRSRDAPTAFLKGFTGFVHADGYAGYNPVYEGGVTHVGC